MADKGIIFSAPMVRALLAGTKTQTRRLLTRARVFGTPHTPAFTIQGEQLTRALQGADRFRHLGGGGWLWEADAFDWQAPAERTGWMAHIGYAPGDRLYVREAWSVRGTFTDVVEVGYRASERASHTEFVEQWPVASAVPGKGQWPRWPNYGPSIHMPRWASRLWLAVTGVRVQRLQDISEADAIAEGVILVEESLECPREAYAALWDSLHTEPGTRWADNPWGVAVSFDVHRGNIDREAARA